MKTMKYVAPLLAAAGAAAIALAPIASANTDPLVPYGTDPHSPYVLGLPRVEPRRVQHHERPTGRAVLMRHALTTAAIQVS